MLTQIINGQNNISKKQDEQAKDITEIRKSMVEIVKLDQQLANQKEGLTRIGKHVDKVEDRLIICEDRLTDLRLISSKLIVKVSMIAAGASAIVASIFAFTIQRIVT